ncbi:MAG: hypothetical protein AAGI03_12655 [Pseudomonadota bacterium]
MEKDGQVQNEITANSKKAILKWALGLWITPVGSLVLLIGSGARLDHTLLALATASPLLFIYAGVWLAPKHIWTAKTLIWVGVIMSALVQAGLLALTIVLIFPVILAFVGAFCTGKIADRIKLLKRES